MTDEKENVVPFGALGRIHVLEAENERLRGQLSTAQADGCRIAQKVIVKLLRDAGTTAGKAREREIDLKKREQLELAAAVYNGCADQISRITFAEQKTPGPGGGA